MKASRLAAAALLAVVALLQACVAPAPEPQPPLPLPTQACPCLRLIGEATLEKGWNFDGTTVGGLSGIDYDAAQDRYILLSDDRSNVDHARFYTARIHYTAQTLDTPRFTGVTSLLSPSGQPYPPRRRALDGLDVPDPEAVRWLPGGQAFLWTSEGDFARGFGPALRTTRAADGALQRDHALPEAFQPRRAAGTGPRDNATLEGLALMPDGRTAWVAMEGPWLQDGPRATPANGGAPVRITAIDADNGRVLRQIAYQPDAVPHKSPLPGGYTTNGVSEILADGPNHLLVLERSYTLGVGNSVRLYRIPLAGVSDTLGLAALAPGNHTPAPKTLVADFAHLGLKHIDNIEAMAWGPPLPSGSRVLVFVSDDNFNPAQVTQFIAVEYLQ
ncbi:esterase-like activity of phytase family protein [Acidovorax sp.]|uniref:esterase-like activity of phytase family protein n=1 Tax=Acidovorax sp. TaxID=1872122 RepID=UPI002611A67A|nr:esterase-like activity of phytase family protein [Acidovorax sp.]